MSKYIVCDDMDDAQLAVSTQQPKMDKNPKSRSRTSDLEVAVYYSLPLYQLSYLRYVTLLIFDNIYSYLISINTLRLVIVEDEALGIPL